MQLNDYASLPAPLTRRAAISRLGGTLGAIGLGAMLAESPAAQAADVAAMRTHFAPRAKRVIHLFMNGGPFQGDFFDPKPALNRYAGQRPAAVELRTENQTGGLMPVPFRYRRHGQSGLEISELLPRLAGCADDLCV